MSRTVFLHPGDFYFSDGPASVQTILGSCIAFTMRDPVSGWAAMCHCVLPKKLNEQIAGKAGADKFRYVDTTVDAMLLEFKEREIPLERLEIKLFGGANVIDTLSKECAIGSLNCQQAKRSLKQSSLALRAHDTGGQTGRRLLFKTHTGEVFVKRLSASGTTEHHKRRRNSTA